MEAEAWPSDALRLCVNGRWDGAEDVFRALRRRLLSAGEDELDARVAEADQTLSFLLDFCGKRKVFKRLVLECISVVIERPSWRTVYSSSSALQTKAKALPEDIQSALAQKPGVISRSLSAEELERSLRNKSDQDTGVLRAHKPKECEDEIQRAPPSSGSGAVAPKAVAGVASRGAAHGRDTPSVTAAKKLGGATFDAATATAAAQFRAGVEAVLELDTPKKIENGAIDAFAKLRRGCLQTVNRREILEGETSHAPVVLNFLVDFAKRSKLRLRQFCEVFNLLMVSDAWAAVLTESPEMRRRIREELPEDIQAVIAIQHEQLMDVITLSAKVRATSPEPSPGSPPSSSRVSAEVSEPPPQVSGLQLQDVEASPRSSDHGPRDLDTSRQDAEAPPRGSGSPPRDSAHSPRGLDGARPSGSDADPAADSQLPGFAPPTSSGYPESTLASSPPTATASRAPTEGHPREASDKIAVAREVAKEMKRLRQGLQVGFLNSVRIRAIDDEGELIDYSLEQKAADAMNAAADQASKVVDPADWREATTPDGRKYFYHAHTRATQWTRPKEVRAPTVEAQGLRIGGSVEVFSLSFQAWCPGVVEKLTEETAKISYRPPGCKSGEFVTKELPLDHKDLRRAKGDSSAPERAEGDRSAPPSGTALPVGSAAACARSRVGRHGTPPGETDERAAYAELLRQLSAKCGIRTHGGLDVQEVVGFLGTSTLPRPALKEVWDVAVPDSSSSARQAVTVEEFGACCRLVGHCQAMLGDSETAAAVAAGGSRLRQLLATTCIAQPPPQLPHFEPS
mmetsp:Transcript_40373/g.111224  ORF Transcript_40373/g.111224 Transcript_40373/m.111224 type:complete len:797 (+) Transcript_40373:126-2516(+)